MRKASLFYNSLSFGFFLLLLSLVIGFLGSSSSYAQSTKSCPPPSPICEKSNTQLSATWCKYENPTTLPKPYSDSEEYDWGGKIQCDSNSDEALCISTTFIATVGTSITQINASSVRNRTSEEYRYSIIGFIDGKILIADFNTQKPILSYTVHDPEFPDSPINIGSSSSIMIEMDDQEEEEEEENEQENELLSLKPISSASNAISVIGNQNFMSLLFINFTGHPIQLEHQWKAQDLLSHQAIFTQAEMFPKQAIAESYAALMIHSEDKSQWRLHFASLSGDQDEIEEGPSAEWDIDIEAPHGILGDLKFQIIEHKGNFSDTQLRSEDAPNYRFLLSLFDENTLNIFQIDDSSRTITFSKDQVATQQFLTLKNNKIIDTTIFGDRIRQLNSSETEANNCTSIVGMPSQSLWIAIVTSHINPALEFSIVEVLSLAEFGEYIFPEDSGQKDIDGNEILPISDSRVNDPLKNEARNISHISCFDHVHYWYSHERGECISRTHYEFGTLKQTPVRIVEKWRSAPPQVFQGFEGTSPDQYQDPEKVCRQFESQGNEMYARCLAYVRQQRNLNPNSSEGSCSRIASLASAGQNNEYSKIYHTIFVQTSYSVEIFALQPLVCQLWEMLPSDLNKIPYGEPTVDMEVTENSQHLLTIIRRPRYELINRNRLAEICDRLKENPDDQFLQQFIDTCQQSIPGYNPQAPLSSNSFAQYSSLCPLSFLCPSVYDFKIEKVGDGNYTNKPLVTKTCEPGFYCKAGLKLNCPLGFVCPHSGMTIPQPCSSNRAENVTCFNSKLTEPQPCPDGSICPVPFVPPILTPPGTYTLPIGPRTPLRDCEEGDYCPLGRSSESTNPDNTTDILCPPNTYCTAPDIVEPTICNCEVNGTCSWCPAGTVEPELCEPGFRCKSPSEKEPCTMSEWCPAGTVVPESCPAGYYCPTPAEKKECPSGHFCKKGSTFPRDCPPLSICPQGSKEETLNFFGPLAVLGILFLLFVPYKVKQYWQQRVRNRRDKIRQYKFEQLEMQKLRDSEELTSGENNIFEEELKLRAPNLLSHRLPYVIDIEFNNLGLVLKNSSKKRVLAGVIGRLNHGKVTAVMGPSGAGKTTFLTTLAGKASYGHQTGDIYLNGYKDKITKYKKIVGFVPQEDVMHRRLTVYENLLYSGRFRLEASKRKKDIREEVMQVIKLLGLDDVKYELIGDESKRGISGGQRKRVNIGMELVADPTVLFLDEPTSGLDSSSSREVCMALRLIAERGLTIVTVIHQPRYEIFTMFHNVLLLGKGGRTVYLGPSEKAIDYFESIGFPCPPRSNPADFFMDVISGSVPREGDPSFKPEDLFDLWEQHRHEIEDASDNNDDFNDASGVENDYRQYDYQDFDSQSSNAPQLSSSLEEEEKEQKQLQERENEQEISVPVSSSESRENDNELNNNSQHPYQYQYHQNENEQKEQIKSTKPQESEEPHSQLIQNYEHESEENSRRHDRYGRAYNKRRTPTSLWQLMIFLERAMLQQFRNINTIFLDLCLVFLVGLFIGLVFSRSSLIGPADPALLKQIAIPEVKKRLELPFDDPLIAMSCFCALAISLTGITSSMKVFGYEKVIYWREASSGISTIAYFMGKNIAHFPIIVITPVVYLAVYYTIVAPRALLMEFYMILFLLNFAASGIGYFFSVLVQPTVGQLAGVVFILVCTAFSGLRPFLSEIYDLFPPVSWIPYLSLVRWGQEALYLAEMERWKGIFDMSAALDLYGYSYSDYGLCIGIIVTFGVVFRIAALAVMILKDRGKKK